MLLSFSIDLMMNAPHPVAEGLALKLPHQEAA
jgi:hypothetical protein